MSPFFVNVGDPKTNFALIWLKSETSITEEKNDTSDTNYFKPKKRHSAITFHSTQVQEIKRAAAL